MTTTVAMTDRDANSETDQTTEEMTEELTQAFRLLQSKDRNHRERMPREKTITRRKIIVVMMKKECQRARRKTSRKQQLQKPQQKEQKVEEEIKQITIPEVLTIKELADKMKIVPSVIVKKLFMQARVATVNQEIDYETAEEIALEFDVLCEKEEVVDVIEELLKGRRRGRKEDEETSAGSLRYGSR